MFRPTPPLSYIQTSGSNASSKKKETKKNVDKSFLSLATVSKFAVTFDLWVAPTKGDCVLCLCACLAQYFTTPKKKPRKALKSQENLKELLKYFCDNEF